MRTLPDPYVLAVLLLDTVLLLLLFERLRAALQAGADCCRNSYSIREFLGNNYLCTSVRQVFVLLLPFYAITLVVLIIVSLRKKRENLPPASLGLSYFREER